MNTIKNSVMLIGRPGADPEIKIMSNNQKIARFNLAVTEERVSGNNELVENTQWFSIVAFGYFADRIETMVKKGVQVAIEGSLHNNDWTDKKGERHLVTEILVNDFFIINEKRVKPKKVAE